MTFLLTLEGSYGQFHDCSPARVQQCERSLTNLEIKSGLDQSVTEVLNICRDIRRNFHCLLNHTASCVELDHKDRKARLLNEARKEIMTTCESPDAVEEHWKDNACFGSEELRTCVREFEDRNKKRQPGSYPSARECSTYMDYQRCIRRAFSAKESCSKDVEDYIALFLVDTAERLSWICSDNYRAPSRGENIPPPSSAAGSKSCGSLVKDDVDGCTNSFIRQTARHKSRSRDRDTVEPLSEEELKTKNCCAFGVFSHCVESAVQKKCTRDSRDLLRGIVSSMEGLLGQHCDNKYKYGSSLCSGAKVSTTASFLLLCVALLAFMLH